MIELAGERDGLGWVPRLPNTTPVSSRGSHAGVAPGSVATRRRDRTHAGASATWVTSKSRPGAARARKYLTTLYVRSVQWRHPGQGPGRSGWQFVRSKIRTLWRGRSARSGIGVRLLRGHVIAHAGRSSGRLGLVVARSVLARVPRLMIGRRGFALWGRFRFTGRFETLLARHDSRPSNFCAIIAGPVFARATSLGASRTCFVGRNLGLGRDLFCFMPAADCPSESCCCDDWISGLARDHAGRLAAIARREGASASDALDVVQDAFHTLLGRTDIAALRNRRGEAARLIFTIVRNAARNLRRRHRSNAACRPREPRPRQTVRVAAIAASPAGVTLRPGRGTTWPCPRRPPGPPGPPG